MFEKVLIVEDHEVANFSVQHALKSLGISQVDYVYYCDDALTWMNNAIRNNNPYDLIITDLYFEDDGQPQHLKGGADLIQAVRMIQPELKIIVFSGEGKPQVVTELFDRFHIHAYVRKARRDGQYLKEALEAVARGRSYKSPDIDQLLKKDNIYEFSALDLAILELLASGVLQKEIPDRLKERQLRPSSLSSVEKKLSHIKEMLGFHKNEQLIAYCKDLGVI